MFNHYGLDWGVFFFVMVHLWLLGRQKRSAFLYGLVANIIGLFWNYLIESWAGSISNLACSVLLIRGYLLWRDNHHENHV